MTKLYIDEVCPKDSTYPLIANFLHGNPTEHFQTEECLLLKRKANNLKTVLTKVDNLLYIGDEEHDDLSKTFIVKRNKSTGKVQILEAGIVNLKPIITVNTDNIDSMVVSNLELSRKFGSKKQRQTLEQQEKFKINVETVTEQMQNVTKEITAETLDLSSYDKSNSDDFYIPKIYRDATKVEDVYRIDDLLTEQQIDRIYSEIETKDYASDLLPLTQGLVANKTLSEKLIAVFLYADTLLKLHNTPAKDLAKKDFVICPHSSTLNQITLSNFTAISKGKRARSAPYKDRTLCHAIVLLLLGNKYKLDLESFAETVKLTPITCSTKARVTGASIVSEGSKKFIHLKLPLLKTTFKRRSAKF